MKKLQSTISIALFFTGTAFGPGKITGLVKDEEGQPVPGATAHLKKDCTFVHPPRRREAG